MKACLSLSLVFVTVIAVMAQNEDPPTGWKYISAKDSTFKVLFPSESVSSGSRERSFTRNKVTAKLQINYSTLKDNTTLQVASIGLSGAGLKGLKPNDICDLVIAAEKENGSTVSEPKEAMIGTLKGREYIITTSRGTRRLILSVVGGRVILLSVDSADADKTKSETANTFLKSLVMTTPELAKVRPPAKNEESKQADPSAVKWTLDLKEMKVPDAAVAGKVGGKEFRPDKVTLEVGFLTFRQGKEFFADKEVQLSLFLKANESVENKTYEVPALDKIRIGIPHISVSTKEPADQLPKTETYSSKYALKLTFGKAEKGVIPGKIYLSVPDEGKTVLAGTFQVEAK